MAASHTLQSQYTTAIAPRYLDRGAVLELADLPVGETGTVESIQLEGKLRSYVMRFGLVEGAQVLVVRRVPLGSLRVYRVGQSEVALRPETAKQILVTGIAE